MVINSFLQELAEEDIQFMSLSLIQEINGTKWNNWMSN